MVPIGGALGSSASGGLNAPRPVSMEMTVEIDQVGEREWNQLLPQFADATIYQSWAFGAVCYGEKQLSHIVLRRGKVAVAMAQVRVVQLPIVKAGVAYVRWGPLWRRMGEALDAHALNCICQALVDEYVVRRGLLLRVIPHVYEGDLEKNNVQAAWEQLGVREPDGEASYRTFRVDVMPPLEHVRKGLQQRWRNYLKSAEGAGFQVSDGTQKKFYDEFLWMYDEMMARKRFETSVDVREFGRIQERLPAPLKMRVFLCENQGNLMNALVVSRIGETGIYLLAATSNAGLEGKGAHLLQWTAMTRLHEEGAKWYDLGGCHPERNPGVYQFKKGMGGAESLMMPRRERVDRFVSRATLDVAERLRKSSVKWRRALGKSDGKTNKSAGAN